MGNTEVLVSSVKQARPVLTRPPLSPGCLPNITRNAIVNCSELVTYDLIKELILKRRLMTGECMWSLLPGPERVVFCNVRVSHLALKGDVSHHQV